MPQLYDFLYYYSLRAQMQLVTELRQIVKYGVLLKKCKKENYNIIKYNALYIIKL